MLHLGKIEAAMQKGVWHWARKQYENLSSQNGLYLVGQDTLWTAVPESSFGVGNRRDPNESPIIDAETLERYRLHHQFLQAARIPFEFKPDVPASIFVYDTLEPADNRAGFDFRDNPLMLSISIRIDKVGIIACLQDGGAVKYSFGDY